MASAVAAALTLSSCLVLPFMSSDSGGSSGGSGGSGGSAPKPTAVATPPADHPELAEFYGQTLTWRPCSGGECATLTVPVDYAKPTGDKIKLALLRVLAKNCLLYTSPSPRD